MPLNLLIANIKARPFAWLRTSLIVGTVGVGIFALGGQVDVEDDVARALVPGDNNPCPSGWEFNDASAIDARSLTCSQVIDGQAILVHLNLDHTCNSWQNLDTGQVSTIGTACEELAVWDGD